VLHGLVAKRHGHLVGLLVSSATFGLFHVAPTLAALRINGISTGRLRACAAAVTLTSVAGLAFGGLRLAGGHVAAPWVVHWAINAASLAAAARWHRAGGVSLRARDR
jgi:membrane protease YdiL (CAAX protease family)